MQVNNLVVTGDIRVVGDINNPELDEIREKIAKAIVVHSGNSEPTSAIVANEGDIYLQTS